MKINGADNDDDEVLVVYNIIFIVLTFLEIINNAYAREK